MKKFKGTKLWNYLIFGFRLTSFIYLGEDFWTICQKCDFALKFQLQWRPCLVQIETSLTLSDDERLFNLLQGSSSWFNFSNVHLVFRMSSSCSFTNKTFSCSRSVRKYFSARTSSKHSSDPSQTSSSFMYSDTVWMPVLWLEGIAPESSERDTLRTKKSTMRPAHSTTASPLK